MSSIPTYYRLPLAFACACLVVSCGGSGSGSSDHQSSNNAQEAPPPPSPVIMSGTAVKGTVINGNVNVYSIIRGQKSDLLASTITDANGKYSVTIPGTYKGPVFIEISARDQGDSTMVCDSATGCGNFIGTSTHDTNSNNVIDFGETYNLDNSFALNALVPSNLLNDSTLSVDVTPITHMAAKYAESFPQGFDDLSAELALTQIGSLFNLDRNPITLSAAPVTNKEAFSTASASEKMYGLVASSIANLSQNQGISTALNDLADEFARNQGQLVTNSSDTNKVTLTKLLEAAQANAQKFSEVFLTTAPANTTQTTSSDTSTSNSSTTDTNSANTALQTQLTTLINTVQTHTTAAQNTTPESLTQAAGTPTAGADNLARIQQFVADLNQWNTQLQIRGQHPAFVDAGKTLKASVQRNLDPMIKSLSVASHYSTLVAFPKLAIKTGCNSLKNQLLVFACHSMVANKSIEDICNQALNLQWFGVSVCDYLNNMTISVGEGLTANYAIYDGRARIYGTMNGIDVDLNLVKNMASENTVKFVLTGSVNIDNTALTIDSGSIDFGYPNGISSTTLKSPSSVAVNAQVTLQETDENESVLQAFTGQLGMSSQLVGANNEALPVNSIPVTATLNGRFTKANETPMEASMTLDSTQTQDLIGVVFDIRTTDLTETAKVDLKGDSSYNLTWNGRRYHFDYTQPNLLKITNQDSVVMTLNTAAIRDADLGQLFIGDAPYGKVYDVNGSTTVTLPNNTESTIF